MTRQITRAAVLGAGLLLVACGGETTSDPAPTDPGLTTAPTWHADVAPLIHRSCVGCHHPGGIGQFSLETHAEAAALAGPIAAAVSSGRMPPWGAQDTEACTPRLPFADDLRLSTAEVALFEAWAQADAPEGDAATAAPLPAIELDTLDGVEQRLASAVPFTTVGTSDQFRCFVLDPELTEDAYVDGVHFAPGNPAVVHHLLLYVDQDGEESVSKADADGGYDCFGGPEIDSPELMAAWAPGGLPTEYPTGSGFKLDAGARLVLQIHYHPLGPDDPQQDTTEVQLRYTDSTPEYLAFTALLGNFEGPEDEGGLLPVDGEAVPEFLVPAGARNHVERMRYAIPETFEDRPFPGMYVHSVASHMHYVGTDMRIMLSRPEKNSACDEDGVAPLRTCLDANCGDMAGDDIVDCAVAQCAAAVATLPSTCTDCLVGQVGAGVEDFYSPCLEVSRPTQYGPLPDQPAEECLLQTPNWDFSWQRFYTYDAPIAELPFLEAGDVFDFECTFDNSMENPFVREALTEQGLDGPRDVVLGDETLDEMCLIALTVLYKWPEAE